MRANLLAHCLGLDMPFHNSHTPGELIECIDGDVDTAIHTAVLEDDVAQMTERLDTVIGPRGVRLSGGQVQRTAAARIFVRQPKLLVFDDLSSALDVETEQMLWSRLFARDNPPACLGAGIK